MFIISKVISLVLIFTIISGCGAFYSVAAGASVNSGTSIASPDETEQFEKLYPFDSNGIVNVSNINGSITLEAWDSPQIKLEYEKVAGSREELSAADVKIDAGQDSFRVEVDYSNRSKWGKGGNVRVDMRLTVPRTAVLNDVNLVNGNLAISGMTNKTNASVVNGDILAKNLSGTLRISSVNGTVDAELTQLNSGSEIDLSTVNGTLNLYLPANADAVFSGKTVNGDISNDFGLTVTKKKYGPGSSLGGKLGGGSSKIDLSSVNGTINIKQGGPRNL